ncbi:MULTISPECIES: SDR family NAD(P)-dependent oxidoreductase [Tsukamurella]|uniref:SDR family NAD(P)-dependent oxidoreductase n=2 Tax=Tsukamurella TaxID=2060 RepID=A0A5C5S6J1_9ACTN|nr:MULTISPECIES: SDR family NAD(P)-dependent oxidoreductase [Tsukamurella]NMD55321.1 SDR family NAD(P)-dependent oxidoreductase [Tsukamurella columbiensis]TWS30714.1 SDR family NAD(P)-dependent oxidoreductase [Tsukamurella conjunctivitidis]
MTDSPVWLVTGASKGIGLEVVKAALASGARVAATTRSPDKLTAELDDPHLLALPMQVTDEADVHGAVARVEAELGRIDVLVNNAGYSLLGAVEEVSLEDVRANFDVNVFGVLTVTRAVLPGMRARRSGRILNLASISARVTGPAQGIYSASKAAVLLLTEALDAEIAPLGLHAVAICPGGVRTDFLDASSSRRPATTIDDYASVAGTLAALDRLNHNQGGDPALLARALVTIAAMPEPPTRMYLGADALHAILRTTDAERADAERYADLSRSISH